MQTERESIAVGNFEGREAEARISRDQLVNESSRLSNDSGDRFVQSGKHVLVSLAGTDAAPVFDLLGETNFHPIPDHVARATILAVQGIRNQMIMTDNRL